MGCCDSITVAFNGLANSAGVVLRDALRGEPVRASKEARARRMEICETCEHFIKRRCALCKCFMSIKTRLAAMECDAGKWLAEYPSE